MTHDPRQLSALKLYEEAASEERQAMRMSILPTLVSVSATGIIGGLTTGERREHRAEDARYCAKYFAGHVVFSPLDVVLARLGTSALVDKLAELKKVARTQLNATLKEAVLANLSKESIPASKPADRAIDNRYWLSRLADYILHVAGTNEPAQAALKPAAGDSLLVVDYFPSPAEKLAEQKQPGYNKTRKYDASLRPSAAKASTIFNILVNVEFTKTHPPTVASNPLIEHVAKLASLANSDPLPHDDVESAVYVLLKVLTQTFLPPVDQQRDWVATLANYYWDNSDVTLRTLMDLRLYLWSSYNHEHSTIGTTLRIFRSTGHAAPPTYDAVLLLLQELVEQAVAAVRSVDASSLRGSSAGEVDELE
ncbi:hypothetical protein B0H17DRAFT_1127824 [Mycena rosella]|uniref:Uncharacterized protein n=1 Tax=Mycena rosella TaxID=1033263 RepID=A0AAD7DXQ7_MYCRO|nr:hypothetical protein B0H17DRAFT_1127824 [Mycena rosella]